MGPIIVQSDLTILLEVDHEYFKSARDALLSFAELVKSPEHIHTYRLTPISLWNAASAGYTPEYVIENLKRYSKYQVPELVITFIRDNMSRYGKIRLLKEGDDIVLTAESPYYIEQILSYKKAEPYILARISPEQLLIKPEARGLIKQCLISIWLPVEDLAGYTEGAPFPIILRDRTTTDEPFVVRDYQLAAISAFWGCGVPKGGSGTIVLPCGSGKTIVGIGIMEKISSHTLIVVTNITAVRQWIDELIDKTYISPDDIAEYSGERKGIKPITIATYQILTYRRAKTAQFEHLGLFDRKDWGLIIYDEVHLLPAPVFRATATIQSKRRLGLTATLVREDGLEGDVFSLIGPKKYDIAWRVLEEQNYIARALCNEVRVPMPTDWRLMYATSDIKPRFRIASENPAKLPVVKAIIEKHRDGSILVIGQYISQLEKIAVMLGAPLIQGMTPNKKRIECYEAFRCGKLKLLVVSKVANFAVDLPDANVAVQVSGTFGSRQEEAQRLGRILRPKRGENIAYFYTLVSDDTIEQDFSAKRQLFLTEQGYEYRIVRADEVVE
ncbi:MAG: DNA repair helicase XPB [bacterium]